MSHLKRYCVYTAIAINGVALTVLGIIVQWYASYTGEGNAFGHFLFYLGLSHIAWILYKVATAFIK